MELTKLSVVALALTTKCNSRCVTCDYWRVAHQHMPMSLVEHLAQSFAMLGVRRVLLTGGEPTQHPQWIDIVQFLHTRGIQVALFTHGVGLTKHLAAFAPHISEATISLDGSNASTYKAIRGIGAFDNVVESVRVLRSIDIPVRIRMTVQRANYREMPSLIALAKSLNVSKVTFQAVDESNPHVFARDYSAEPTDAADTLLRPDDVHELAEIVNVIERDFADDFQRGFIHESPSQLRQLVNYFGAAVSLNEFPKMYCNIPLGSIVVEPDGSLRPCFFLPSWGRLGERSLHEALNDRAAIKLREEYRLGQRVECKTCICAREKPYR
jgi:MoaA/NifB/PqqE/SkfB family radical SAM enzyme